MTDLDRVRLAIGDNTLPMHFSNEDILEFIDQKGGNWRLAAAEACFSWARWLARQPNFTLGTFSESGNQQAAKLLNEKGQELLAEVQAGHVGLYAGGISIADNEAIADDDDRPKKDFSRRMMENVDAS